MATFTAVKNRGGGRGTLGVVASNPGIAMERVPISSPVAFACAAPLPAAPIRAPKKDRPNTAAAASKAAAKAAAFLFVMAIPPLRRCGYSLYQRCGQVQAKQVGKL